VELLESALKAWQPGKTTFLYGMLFQGGNEVGVFEDAIDLLDGVARTPSGRYTDWLQLEHKLRKHPAIVRMYVKEAIKCPVAA